MKIGTQRVTRVILDKNGMICICCHAPFIGTSTEYFTRDEPRAIVVGQNVYGRCDITSEHIIGDVRAVVAAHGDTLWRRMRCDRDQERVYVEIV